MGKSLSQKTKKNYALADAMLCVGTCNALRWHMQCFALALAMLCVGTCNALRCHLQCFALGHPPYCVWKFTILYIYKNPGRSNVLPWAMCIENYSLSTCSVVWLVIDRSPLCILMALTHSMTA